MRNYVAAAMTFLAIDAVGSAVLSPMAHAADPVSECAPGVRVDLKTPLPAGITPAGCATLVLDPGMRPKLNITGHTGGVQGVLALRCKEPVTCIFATGSVVANVDGFILDGVQIRGGSNGHTIKASKNVLIQRSIFQEQTSSGVLINPGTMNINIQICNNQFINSLRGCNYLNSDVCDFFSRRLARCPKWTMGSGSIAQIKLMFREHIWDNIQSRDIAEIVGDTTRR